MKHVFGFLLLAVFSLPGFSQDFGSLSKPDQNQVIQKIVDLPELQQHYRTDVAGNVLQLYVSQYPMALPTDLTVTKANLPLLFIDAASEANYNGYFKFRRIAVTGNTVNVTCSFTTEANGVKKMIAITVELNKLDANWTVISSTLNVTTL